MNAIFHPAADRTDSGAAAPGLAVSAAPTGPPDDAEADTTGGGPGAQLRRARQARRLEPVRIATELRLKPAIIDALERDDYDALPGAVFAAGYLRSYARLLGLDPEPLLDAFRAAHPAADLAPARRPAQTPGEEVEAGGGLLVPVFSGLVVIALLGGVYLWWENRELAPAAVNTLTEPPPRVPVPSVTAAPAPTPATPTGRSAPLPGDHAPAATPAGADALAPPTAAPVPIPVPIQAPPPVAASPTGPTAAAALPAPTQAAAATPTPPTAPTIGSLPANGSASGSANGPEVVLAFSGPSWVDVRDASGEFRLVGEMGRGDRKVLGGEPPYSLILGNASAVAVTIGAAPYDLTPVSRGNVARFQLNPAEAVSAATASAAGSPGAHAGTE